MESVELDKRAGELVMIYEYEPDRGRVAIRLPAEAGGALVNTVRDTLQGALSEAPSETKPQMARGATAVTLPSGDVWVGIKVEDSDTPILMDPETVAQLREVLAKLPS